MIKVLIAEDSMVFQKVLVSFLKKESNIEIIGIVDNGFEAVEQCKLLKPDLITMDIFMPKMNGLEATRRIMAECPTRIVIISSMIDAKNLQYSLEAIQAGAVEVIAKPQDMITGNYDAVQDKLVKVLRQTMAAEPMKRFSWLVSRPWEISTPVMVTPTEDFSKTERRSSPPGGIGEYEIVDAKDLGEGRGPSRPIGIGAEEREGRADGSPIVVRWRPQPIPDSFTPHIICIGGSTGAPAVISDVLRCLPGNFAVPILIAQHIVKGFVKGMADWLDSIVEISVKIAVDGEKPQSGKVLFAPDDNHLDISGKGRIKLSPRNRSDLYVPSVNRLFSAAANAYGAFGLGIVLSGMGRDGADGLLEMREAGAVTIGQNAATSVVYGMPKVAVARGAVMDTMGPEGMVRLLLQIHERIIAFKPSD
jgi:two-component system, chemotaxis family, protein-glutamate methylesterase/glutaminase